MPILGINNRTENWKTAYEFSPFFKDENARARLARTLDESQSPTGNDVRIELFWKGMRDYINGKLSENQPTPKECAEAYNKLFPRLRAKVDGFAKQRGRTLNSLQDNNYDVSSSEREEGLYNNLLNTEIDIVLETPGSLFIGEAKGEMGLGADGGLILVHQLIRQYVTASILLDIMGIEKNVVPFLVVEEENRESMMNTGQVRFMTDVKRCLKKENVLTWRFIRTLQP